MPSFTAYVSRHRQIFRSLKSPLKFSSWYRRFSYKSSKATPSDSEEGFGQAERIPSSDARYDHALTLGSAVRGGKFMKTVDEKKFNESRFGTTQVVYEGDDTQEGRFDGAWKDPRQTMRGEMEFGASREQVNEEKRLPPHAMV